MEEVHVHCTRTQLKGLLDFLYSFSPQCGLWQRLEFSLTKCMSLVCNPPPSPSSWSEPCFYLTNYLIVIAITCIGNSRLFMYLGSTAVTSDTEWVWLLLYVFLGILTMPFLLYWAVLTLVNESGWTMTSINPDLPLLCSRSSPRTFMYALVATCMYIVTLVLTSFILFMRIVPSLIKQAKDRSFII